MPLSKISDLQDQFNSLEEIDNEILELKRKLAELRFKKVTQKMFNSHEFKFTRRKIAQLNLLKTNLKP